MALLPPCTSPPRPHTFGSSHQLLKHFQSLDLSQAFLPHRGAHAAMHQPAVAAHVRPECHQRVQHVLPPVVQAGQVAQQVVSQQRRELRRHATAYMSMFVDSFGCCSSTRFLLSQGSKSIRSAGGDAALNML